MKTRIFLVVSALLAATGCTANAVEQDDESTTDESSDAVTEKSNGRTVTVTEGNDLVLKLPANLTTGFDWIVTSTDRSFGYPTKTFKVDSAAVGSGGVDTFTWKTRGFFSLVGKHSVELEYKRSWEKTAAKKFSFTVNIVANKLWPSTATKLVAKVGGGFVRPGPEGSTCGRGMATYSLELATRKLTSEVCRVTSDTAPLHLAKSTRTLTAAELSTVDAAMRNMRVSKQDICGADKPFATLAVTAGATTTTLTDEFYSCRGDETTYVTNIGGVFAAFRAITE